MTEMHDGVAKSHDSFNVDDIHRIREEHYESIKHMRPEELISHYNESGERAWEYLQALQRDMRRLNETG